MERKDYEQKFEDIKADILREIKSIIPEDTAHRFKETFNIHFIDGEIATTEVCTAVEVWFGGMVAFIVKKRGDSQEEVIQGEAVYDYASESFIDILDHLKKEIREKKTFRIRAYETFSRIFEVEASNYEEAVELARKELEALPFEKGDSDGLCFD